MKRWGLRASSLSTVTKVDAGQVASCNHLKTNVLYMMLGVCALSFSVSPWVGKTYSFAIFGCSAGLCELQMCMAFALAIH